MDLIKVFQENQVRIIGTNDSPLFVASDIAKILDIKNINDAISDFEEYEKMGIAIPDPHGR
jgi:prophage antirepressor-like protein